MAVGGGSSENHHVTFTTRYGTLFTPWSGCLHFHRFPSIFFRGLHVQATYFTREDTRTEEMRKLVHYTMPLRCFLHLVCQWHLMVMVARELAEAWNVRNNFPSVPWIINAGDGANRDESSNQRNVCWE